MATKIPQRATALSVDQHRGFLSLTHSFFSSPASPESADLSGLLAASATDSFGLERSERRVSFSRDTNSKAGDGSGGLFPPAFVSL